MTNVEEVYKRGYTHGLSADYHDGFLAGESKGYEWGEKQYEQGLNDAWECMKTLCKPVDEGGITWGEMERMLGDSYHSFYDVINDFTPSELMKKVKEYEESKKFHVGDEIENDDRTCVITKIVDEHYVNIMYVEKNGSIVGAMGYIDPTKYNKTGRHFPQIEEVLNAMKEKINE